MGTKKIVIDNILRLMDFHKIPSQNALAKAAKVDQKTINDFMREENKTSSIKLVTLDKIAKALKVCGWHLLVPSLPIEFINSAPKCSKISPTGFSLLTVYETASDEVKREIIGYTDYILDRSGDSSHRDKIRTAVQFQENKRT